MSLCYDLLVNLQVTVSAKLRPVDSAIVSACIQADATIRAAKKQATAALWGDIATITAALAALAAGILVYRAASAAVRDEQKRRRRYGDLYSLFVDQQLRDRIKVLDHFASEMKRGDLREVQRTIPNLRWSLTTVLPPTWTAAESQALTNLTPDILHEILKADRNTIMTSRMLDEILERIFYTADELKKDAEAIEELIVRRYKIIRSKMKQEYPDISFES